ncbi:MAG: PilZ domain-containing protein [Sphingomicrobium sp.]
MQRIHGWIGRNDRVAVVIDAVVHRDDGSVVPVKVTDFSDQGCRMEGDELFRIGERIHVAVPRLGTLAAQVRWAIDGSAGARFLLDPEA